MFQKYCYAKEMENIHDNLYRSDSVSSSLTPNGIGNLRDVAVFSLRDLSRSGIDTVSSEFQTACNYAIILNTLVTKVDNSQMSAGYKYKHQ